VTSDEPTAVDVAELAQRDAGDGAVTTERERREAGVAEKRVGRQATRSGYSPFGSNSPLPGASIAPTSLRDGVAEDRANNEVLSPSAPYRQSARHGYQPAALPSGGPERCRPQQRSRMKLDGQAIRGRVAS
jgi:hypothetical protein